MKLNIIWRALFLYISVSAGSSSFAEPIPGNDLFKPPTIYSMRLSPNGELLLAHVYANDHESLYLTRSDLSQPVYLTKQKSSPEKININDYEWIDNDTIYYSQRSKINFIDIDANSKTDYQPKEQHIYSNGYLVSPLSDKEDTFIYKKYTNGRPKIYTTTVSALVSGKIPKSHLHKHLLKDAFQYRLDKNKSIRFAFTVNKDNLNFHYLDNNKKWQVFYTITDSDYSFFPIDFIDENTIAVLSNATTNTMSVVSFDIRSNTFGEAIYSHNQYDLVDAAIDKNGNLDYIQYYAFGKLVTEYFSTQRAHKNELLHKAFPGKQVMVVQDLKKQNLQLLLIYASDDSGGYVLFNTKTHDARYLYNIHTYSSDYAFTKTQPFSVTDANGDTFEAMLTRPDINNGVLLVMPHGGPIGVRDYVTFNPQIQYFSSRGYTVLQVNFRGSQGYGRDFKEKGVGEFGVAIEKDISAAVAHIKKQHNFNATCSIGSSYGGYSAMMLAITYPEDYDCIIAMYGIYDLNLLFNESNMKTVEPYRAQVERVVGTDKASFNQRSPVYLADKITQPVLLIAGKKDTVASFEHSNRMKYMLNQHGNYPDTLFYEKAGHGQNTYKGYWHQNAYIDNFIKTNLQLNVPSTISGENIIPAEYQLIKKYHLNERILSTNKHKAEYFITQDGAFGRNEILYKSATALLNGDQLNQDVEMAIAAYNRASQHGDAKSSIALAEIYSNPKWNRVDEKKAIELYHTAVDQHANSATVGLAYIYTLGSDEYRDFPKAISLLASLKDAGQSTPKLKEVLSRAVFNNNLNNKEKALATSYIKEHLSLHPPKRSQLQVLREGAFGSKGAGYLNSPTKKLKMEKHDTFGVHYSLRKSTVNDEYPSLDFSVQEWGYNEYPRALVKVRWTHPPITSPTTGITKTSTERIDFALAPFNSRVLYKAEEDWQRVSGDWTLEIFNVNNELLYRKTFKVVWKK